MWEHSDCTIKCDSVMRNVGVAVKCKNSGCTIKCDSVMWYLGVA